MIEQPRQFTRRVQSRNRNVIRAQHLGFRICLDTSIGESQVGSHRIPIIRRFVNGIGPIGLVGLETGGALPVKLHEIEVIAVTCSVEFFDRFVELVGVHAEFLRQLGNGIGLFGLLVCRIVDPAWSETLHGGRVADEVGSLVMVTPGFEGDHFECSEELSFAFIVEALAVLVDDNAVV